MENPKTKLRYKDLEGTNRSINTPALRIREEQNAVGSSNNNNTEKLSQIHTSFINNPSIKTVKNKEKIIRDEERRNINLETKKGKDNDKDDTNFTNHNLSNNVNRNLSNTEDKNKSESHIKLVEDNKNYSIKEDLNNSISNITLGQLLDVSPKLRSELMKLLRLDKGNIVGTIANLDPEITLVNNLDHDYESNSIDLEEDELAMVLATAGSNKMEARLLLDTCSNLNVITKDFLEKIGPYESVGFTKSRIRQAANDCEIQESLVVKVPIYIGNLSMNITFRVIDHPDTFYDLLIGLKTLADHKLVIIPHQNSLVYVTDNGSFEHLAYLNRCKERIQNRLQ